MIREHKKILFRDFTFRYLVDYTITELSTGLMRLKVNGVFEGDYQFYEQAKKVIEYNIRMKNNPSFFMTIADTECKFYELNEGDFFKLENCRSVYQKIGGKATKKSGKTFSVDNFEYVYRQEGLK